MKKLYNGIEKKKLELIVSFFRFLKDNFIYEKYKSYYYADNNTMRTKSWKLIDFLRNCGSEGFLTCAFCWCYTKDGFDFWENIHFKWLEYTK